MIKIKETDIGSKEDVEKELTKLFKDNTFLNVDVIRFGTNMWRAIIVYKEKGRG